MRKPLFLYVPLSEKILFAKHLSIMVKTGMTLFDSLTLIKKQMRSKSFAYILERVISDVENGQFLSQSLMQFESLFGELFINIIKIGEGSGMLAENLVYLASELRKKQLLRQKIKSASIYPFVILAATIGVTGILVFFVMPRITPIFSSLRIELPWTTKSLIAVSNFLFEYGLWLLAAVFALTALWFLLIRLPKFRFLAHRLLLILPFFGQVSKMANVAEFTRTFGLLLKSGTKIVEALIITASSMQNLVYRRALQEASLAAQRGESLHSQLGRREDIFFPIATRMIEVGDATGTLESNLFYLADFYENEVDEITKNLSSVLEPVLLLLMGVIVGFVAVSIITPIYEITQTLHP
ncbi:MAG: type II secretion system F family protein [Parcubacteria group bacterium]|nr:type II secretion system F family protein [Parcubacteria group bacterium]